jgi:hypothetical protein
MKTQEPTYLHPPRLLGQMTREQLIDYIDKLHSIIRTYQVVIDVAIDKNMRVK